MPAETDTPIALDGLYEVAEVLRGFDLRVRSIDDVRNQLKKLMANYRPLFLYKWVPRQPMFRFRLCKDEVGYSSLHDMIYPQNGSPDFGRAQLPGSKVLYASLDMATALDEVGGQPGAVIQSISLQVVPDNDIRWHSVGDLRNWRLFGNSSFGDPRMDITLHELFQTDIGKFTENEFVDSTISYYFRRRSKRPYEYKISAAFSDVLLPSGGIIIYPSVENYGGKNIAIPAQTFDSQFEVMSSTIYRIERAYGQGLYYLSTLRCAENFDKHGGVEWGPLIHEDAETTLRQLKERKLPSPWRKGNHPEQTKQNS